MRQSEVTAAFCYEAAVTAAEPGGINKTAASKQNDIALSFDKNPPIADFGYFLSLLREDHISFTGDTLRLASQ